MAIAITKLKADLLERIDTDNLMEVEKVERYCELIRLYRRIEKEIKNDELKKTTINGAQEFEKTNGLIAELKSLNAQINATGKTINYKREVKQPVALTPVPEKKKISLV